MEKNKQLPLRLNVGIVLLNNKNQIFVAKRIDLKEGIIPNLTDRDKFWQMPQGGIDKNENFLEAAKRELKEETSVKSTKLIKEIDGWIKYYFPPVLQKKIENGRYAGQKQKWFIMRFLGKDQEINIKTRHPEFLDWKWIEISKLAGVAIDFKVHVYKKIVEELNSLNFN